MESDINPFELKQAEPYKSHPEIQAMINLRLSYQNNDINEFESILLNNHNDIMADPLIEGHIVGETNTKSHLKAFSGWQSMFF